MEKELQRIGWLIASLWGVYFLDVLVPINFSDYGLVPRTWKGLVGIPLMPFLHGSFAHLLGNTIPLCILLFILVSSRKDYLEVIVSIVILGGLLLWCFGRSAVHVGASGLVYGLVAFLIAIGFADRKPVSIFIAMFVGFLYGTTLFFGMLPTAGATVSWEGHLLGAVAGIATAFASSKMDRLDDNSRSPQKLTV